MAKKVKKPTAAEKQKDRRRWQRELLGEIRSRRIRNLHSAGRAGASKEGLSVYPSYRENSFPIREYKDRSVPKWRYTNDWMKVYAGVWAMHERDERCLAISINLHPDYEHQLTSATPTPDIRALLRSRVSAELRKVIKDEPPTFFFVIEGRTKDRRATTPLHIHGALLVNDPSKDDAVRRALKRACGHYIKKRDARASAARVENTYRLVNRWASYCMKNIRIRDTRMEENRIAMSLPLIQAARLWWEIATGT